MKGPTDPLRQMQRLSERLREAMAMHRLRPARPRAWQPPMDVQASDEAYVIRLDLPGAAREQIEASAEDGVLRVRGEVTMPARLADARRVRAERPMGRFARSLRLPSDADMSDASATLSDGVLTLRVGRRRQGGRIRIEIGQ